MDIYLILKEHGEELIKEDLDFFELELSKGVYNKEYIDKCMELIRDLKVWKTNKTQTVKDEIDGDHTKKNINPTELTYEERQALIKKKVENCRSSDNYDEKFIKLIYEYKIDEKIVDDNFVFFKQIELYELLRHVKFSESFLDKHFKFLESNTVAEYQLYSEEFFMKHYSKMNYSIVLKKSNNPWKDKSKRSSKLNVFLKLKGVSI